MKISIKLEKLPEFERAFSRLSGTMKAGILRPVFLDGATVLQGTVQQEAAFSSKTGALQRSIVAKLAQRSDEAVAYMAVDFAKLTAVDKRGKKIRYPYIVEHGARPHIIKASGGKGALKFGGTFTKEVKHPGFRGREFFRRGVARGRPRAKSVIESGLVRKIEALNRGA